MDFLDDHNPGKPESDNNDQVGVAPGVAKEKPKSAEMTPGPGFMIRNNFPRPLPEIYQGLRDFQTADVSDVLNRLYAMCGKIRNLSNEEELLGPACTVKLYPGDNLMVHKALDIARPGDVVVVDCGGARTNAVLGDLIANKAKHRGIAGFIIDGLIRDIDGVRETGLPVYARGVTPFGPLHRGPGEINTPICCGGVVVHPGDIIKADATGIAVVPRDYVVEILRRLQDSERLQREYIANVKRGVFSNAWVDAQLRENNCAIGD